MKSLSEWLHTIEQLHPAEIELGLDRVRSVAERLDVLSFDATVITVAGTNGKGSTISGLEALLSDFNVGSYTSPHIWQYNERVKFNRAMVSGAQLCAAFEAVEQARGEVELTYFEFGTLAALWIFKQKNLDFVLLEVGLGGRLDAVNIVDSDLAIITNIALDHTDWLGDDREKIGFEKSGIMRAGKPVICGDRHPPQALLDQAQKLGCPLYRFTLDYDFSEPLVASRGVKPSSSTGYVSTHTRLLVSKGSPSEKLVVPPENTCNVSKEFAVDYDFEGPLVASRGEQPFSGTHTWQWKTLRSEVTDIPLSNLLPENLSHSLMAVHCLGVVQEDEFIRRALSSVENPGRFQQCEIDGVPHIFDVGHNPAAAQSLFERLSLLSVAGDVYAVVGMMADKDIVNVLQPLKPLVKKWFMGELNNPRSAKKETLEAVGGELKLPGEYYEDIIGAHQAALSSATENDCVVVFGSFFTVEALLCLDERDL